MTQWKSVAFWAGIALALGGCFCCCPLNEVQFGTSPDKKQSDIVGTWHGDGDATLRLNADGTFTIAHLMDCNDRRDLVKQETDTAEGAWQLGLRDNGELYQVLDLRPQPPVFIDGEWRVEDDDIILVTGDPDAYDECVFSQS